MSDRLNWERADNAARHATIGVTDGLDVLATLLGIELPAGAWARVDAVQKEVARRFAASLVVTP